MPEYYKLFYSSSQEIPPSFYKHFIVISKLEFPLYQELLIKRPHAYNKLFLKFKLISLCLPNPLFLTHVNCFTRCITSPLHYSTFENEHLKMFTNK